MNYAVEIWNEGRVYRYVVKDLVKNPNAALTYAIMLPEFKKNVQSLPITHSYHSYAFVANEDGKVWSYVIEGGVLEEDFNIELVSDSDDINLIETIKNENKLPKSFVDKIFLGEMLIADLVLGNEYNKMNNFILFGKK